ncbi:hypothetical protein FRC00_006234 [Tulasnella sp. 408]|nr:hypothetical protein FRC00_006234 [Tulasnella sp. 408]
MEDPPISQTKVDRFKRSYKRVIPTQPLVVRPSGTSTWKYTPPRLPRPDGYNHVELVLDSDIPACLINGLDRFADGLEEDQLDDELLEKAENSVRSAGDRAATIRIKPEVSVLPGFTRIVAEPVQDLCQLLRVNADYREGPRLLNMNPDHAWAIDDELIMIFEHKTPRVLNHHSSQIISMARKQQSLNLLVGSTGGESIIAKLILASLYNGYKYCVIHSLTSFIVIHLGENPETGRHQARISKTIPLTSTATPVIAVILALILHSRRDGSALEYQSLGLNVSTSSEAHNEEDEDLDSGTMGSGPHNPTDQKEDTSSGNHSAGFQVHAPSTFAASEYWEPEEIPETTLAALLRTTDGISLYWELKPLSREIYRLIRRDDSSIWGRDPPTNAIPRLILHSPLHHHITPPPSPPVTPFALELNSAIGGGVVGSVYKGHFLGLSIPLVVKLLSTSHMDHELEMWRKLHGLAGICVPGLFGAYWIEGQDGSEETGALVQQYAGQTLSTFDTLDHKQRRELYVAVTRIHEAHVEHGDLSPQNVALDDDGRVMVLDFSHSDHHECKGEESCWELEDMRRVLNLEE